MKTYRVITINYRDFLLPEDITPRQVSDLITTLASMRVVENTGREIAGKWTPAAYTEGIKITYEPQVQLDLFGSREQAHRHFDCLELEASQPETVGDPF
jgi:hypothetical protein